MNDICIWYTQAKKWSLLLHILVLFKNYASLPLGKKNEQCPELFTKKKSPDNSAVPWQTTNREPKKLQSHKSKAPLAKYTSALWWHAASQSNSSLWGTWTQDINDLFNLFTSNEAQIQALSRASGLKCENTWAKKKNSRFWNVGFLVEMVGDDSTNALYHKNSENLEERLRSIYKLCNISECPI